MLNPSLRQHFPLQETKEPNLLRDIFPYTKPPLVEFDSIPVPMNLPEDFFITDTTFRDGQQARAPYTREQIIQIFKYLHKLAGPKGVIRQTEFFMFSAKDRENFEACKELDYEFPEITTWIRATASDVALLKGSGIKETGILTSVSDYHIFLKLGSDRKKILDKYLGVVKEVLSQGLVPRCHFEDVTRADIYGFVLPFGEELKKLSEESKVPIKIRLCDTMGYGLPFAASALPRSVPKLFFAFNKLVGYPSAQLEWHGHNDFHLVLANSMACWLFGGAAVNASLLGIGERTGNCPLEGLLMNYISLKGSTDGVDTQAITEMAEYMEAETNTRIPENYPFVGRKFNVTRAGIHADGVIKNEEIYNIFDTKRILNRPLGIIIADKAGTAGIALWINMHFKLEGAKQIDKRHPGVLKINDVINKDYDETQRATAYSDEELEKLVRRFIPEVVPSEFERIKSQVEKHVTDIIEQAACHPDIKALDAKRAAPALTKIIEDNPFIQLSMLTDSKGQKIVNVIALHEKPKFQNFTKTDFSDSEWFVEPASSGKTFVMDFYTSKYTGEVCLTISTPVTDAKDKLAGVLSFDIQFEEAAKLE
jgi:isopropylmalate/homocitrate/citramalate synthase